MSSVQINTNPQTERFLQDVVSGLRKPQKEIPCKYFYDKRGSELFDRICELPEYYPTRTEMAIMRDSGTDIADKVGPNRLVVEYGSGSSLKTRILLDHLEEPAGYVPIDISKEHLHESVDALREEYPKLDVHPICADYTSPIDLPTEAESRPLVFFPGSTIGNFTPDEAVGFLKRTADLVRSNGGALVGVDLKKDKARLEQAYDDAQGVTAEFNLNVLHRMQRELKADVETDAFEHRAVYNEDQGRIEMHLVSLSEQDVSVGGEHTFRIEAGETIRTECSYKYHVEEFAKLAHAANLQVEDVWTDEERLFSVQYLAAA